MGLVPRGMIAGMKDDRSAAAAIESQRLDVWLDVACLFRTRSLAQAACRGGKVEVNGQTARPNRLLRKGDELRITRGGGARQTVVVLDFAEHHVAKALARALYEDRTPPPTPEEKVATGHQLRDERALGLYVARFLRALGEDPTPIADEAERTVAGGRYKVDFLKQPLGYDWVETCPQQMLAARANACSSLASFGSCLVPFAAWSAVHYRDQTALCERWKERTRGLIAAGHRDGNVGNVAHLPR